jgi:colicin import membrane protein
MMRCHLLGMVLLWVPLVVAAAGGDPASTSAERARIQSERQQIESLSGAGDAACYQRFSVNDCLRDVRSRRRAALQDLRRQEVSLNDAERKSRGAAQARRAQDQLDARSDAAVELPGERPLPVRPRAATAAAPDRAVEALPQPTPKAGARPARAARPQKTQPGTATAAARYEQKLRDAAQRQQKRDTRASTRKKPASPPLPPAG